MEGWWVWGGVWVWVGMWGCGGAGVRVGVRVEVGVGDDTIGPPTKPEHCKKVNP